MTAITRHLKRSKAKAARATSASATPSIERPNSLLALVPPAICTMKNRARLTNTPTTAAVMAVSGAVKWRLPWVLSTKGPPARVNKKRGQKSEPRHHPDCQRSAQKPHVGHHHDQWPGGRFPQSQTIHHLRPGQSAIVRLRAGQEHAVIQRVQKAALGDPAFSSTKVRCMMAICPAGPPKLMKPSLNQNRRASQKGTTATALGAVGDGRGGVGATS